MKSIIPLLVAAVFGFACEEKKEKSQRIDAPAVKPPVEESLPTALLNGRENAGTGLSVDYLKTCANDPTAGDPCGDYSTLTVQAHCQVKQRLFCGGPSDMLTLLDGADTRMAEIESRSNIDEDLTIPCFDAASQDATSELTFPNDATFEMYLNCKDADLGLSFGKNAGTTGDNWYIREGKPPAAEGGAGAHVFKITPENLVTGYIWLPTKDGSYEYSTMLLHLRADRAANTVEVTGGGVGIGFCSFHYHSDSDYIYIYSNIAGVGSSCDSDGNGTTDSTDWVETCLTSSLESTDTSNCASLKSGRTLTTLGRDTSSSTGITSSYSAAADMPSGETIVRFEMTEYLKALFEAAGTVSDAIPQFATADK